MRIPRMKVTLRNGRAVYQYRAVDQRLQDEAVDIEDAGYYDTATNDVVMTEPTSMLDGRAAPGA